MSTKRIYGVLLLLGLSCSHHHHHSFDDVEKWEKVFEAESRKKWQKPVEVLKVLNFKENEVVANIGSATGYFSVRIAREARKGRVWASDISAPLVRFLNARARQERLSNLFSILAQPSDPMIPEPVDTLMIVNTLHHLPQTQEYLAGLASLLKKRGRIVIIDFKKGNLPFGPPDSVKLSRDEIIKKFKEVGLGQYESFDFLPYQNLIVFKKGAQS